MSEWTKVLNNLIENLPSIIVSVTGLFIAWNHLRLRIDDTRAVAQASVDRTIEGNVKLAEVHGLIQGQGQVPSAPAEVVVKNTEPIEVVETSGEKNEGGS
jgi:hypothetical protein